MKFYKILKIFLSIIFFIITIVFLLTLFSNNSIIDKIMLGLIFLLDLLVSTILISFYKNFIIDIYYDDENVYFIQCNKKNIVKAKSECKRIIEHKYRIIIIFPDERIVIRKGYENALKTKIDYNMINKDNFPCALFSKNT